MKYLMKSNSFAESKRYLKLFEAKNKNKFWKIRIRKEPYSHRVLPRIEIVLNKIGMNEKDIKFWKDIIKFTENEYIYIFNNLTEPHWQWSACNDDNVYKKAIDRGDQYMGEVIITKEDIELFKLKKVAKKYNI